MKGYQIYKAKIRVKGLEPEMQERIYVIPPNFNIPANYPHAPQYYAEMEFNPIGEVEEVKIELLNEGIKTGVVVSMMSNPNLQVSNILLM